MISKDIKFIAILMLTIILFLSGCDTDKEEKIIEPYGIREYGENVEDLPKWGQSYPDTVFQ